MISRILIGAILLYATLYAAKLFRDLAAHREMVKAEAGNFWGLSALTAGIQCLAAFGISDFAISIPFYKKLRLVDDGRLPGTLVTAGVIPGVVLCILYIMSGEADIATVVLCALAQSLGAVLGVKLVAGLRAETVRKAMGWAMAALTAVVLLRRLLQGEATGTAAGLTPAQLLMVLPVIFLLGVVNMVGFGSKAPASALLLGLGLSPKAALTIIMSNACFGGISGGLRYIGIGRYQRKLTLASSTCALLGVFVGAQFVHSVSMSALQRVMIGILIYSTWILLVPQK